MKLKSQKAIFKIPKDVVYLNTASFSPAFNAIEEAGIQAVLDKNRPDLITVDSFFKPINELRSLFAELIESDDMDRVVNIPSVSYGLANVANNVCLKSTDEILIIDEQFPSNYYIWKKLTDQYGARLKIIEPPKTKSNKGKKWNKILLDSINENTALVAMGHVHWSNGTLFDLKEIRRKTQEFNSLLIIDGSQSVGALPFSVKELAPDALIAAGYKWLFGPYGSAIAYYGPYFDNGNPIEENWINRVNSERFSELTTYQSEYKPKAQRYSVGESSSLIYNQMRVAALQQVIEWQPQRIQEYCRETTATFVNQMRALGCHIEQDDCRSHHMFGVGFPENFDIEKLKIKLEKEKVNVSFRGAFMRVSCHVFNTKEDFEVLLECVKYAMQ
ncbi:MAG: aminotransferase [Flavobacteriaceae bacterium]|nr:aminotransferase [Flavobacteriaceae bacterium]|tara:strand:- start:58848 stop:60008 length:1161 start_codon:yes stop_codon:yes gene_type:complete